MWLVLFLVLYPTRHPIQPFQRLKYKINHQGVLA